MKNTLLHFDNVKTGCFYTWTFRGFWPSRGSVNYIIENNETRKRIIFFGKDFIGGYPSFIPKECSFIVLEKWTMDQYCKQRSTLENVDYFVNNGKNQRQGGKKIIEVVDRFNFILRVIFCGGSINYILSYGAKFPMQPLLFNE